MCLSFLSEKFNIERVFAHLLDATHYPIQYTDNIGTMRKMREEIEQQRMREYEIMHKRKQEKEFLEKKRKFTR